MPSIQNKPGSTGFSDSTRPGSTISNRPVTRGPTNKGKTARVNRSFHEGNSANPASKRIYIFIRTF